MYSRIAKRPLTAKEITSIAKQENRLQTAGAKARGDYLHQYVPRAEAKSLGPDGGPCNEPTHGLLRRTPVFATAFRHIGRETDRLWEQGEDISVIDFETT